MIEEDMHGQIRKLAIILPLLLSTLTESPAAPELDARLAPMAETYAVTSRRIMERGAEQKFRILYHYLLEVNGDLSRFIPAPEPVHEAPIFIPDGRGGQAQRGKKKERYKSTPGDARTKQALDQISTHIRQGRALPAPPGLTIPQNARHTKFRTSLATAHQAIEKERKTLDRQYLAALAKLQAESKEDAGLTAQVEDQKRQVGSGTPCPLVDLKVQLPGTRWQRISAPAEFVYFPKVPPTGSWTYSIQDQETVITRFTSQSTPGANSNTTLKLGEDGKTLVKDGMPDLRLVHPEPTDLLPL